jgi:hypothetical protein
MDSPPAIAANYPFPSCERYPFPSTTLPDGSPAIMDRTCDLMGNSANTQGRYPVLSERPVSKSDLAHLGRWELRVARNEIFARYGYRFGPEKLIGYFGAQSWYQPSDLPENEIVEKLSRTEWHNISLIRQAEFRLRRTRI